MLFAPSLLKMYLDHSLVHLEPVNIEVISQKSEGSACSPRTTEVHLQCTAIGLSFLVWTWNETVIADFIFISNEGQTESTITDDANFTSILDSVQGIYTNCPTITSSLFIIFANETTSFGNISCGDHRYSSSKDIDALLTGIHIMSTMLYNFINFYASN